MDVVARREALIALAPTAVAAVASSADITPVQALNRSAAAKILLDHTEDVTLRVPKDVAAAVSENSAEAVQYLQKVANGELKLDIEAFIGYTPWFTSSPWCSGYYEVRQKSARGQEDCLRMWYSKERNEWKHPNSPLSMPVPHLTFMLSHFWRGLAAPWPAYTYKVPGQRVRLKDFAPAPATVAA